MIRCLFLATIVLFCVPSGAQANLVWTSFTRDNSDIPGDRISSVAFGEHGTRWFGTDGGGLVRLDRQGHWDVYTHASTNGGLPNDHIRALAFGQNGSLWVGTEGGLARLDPQGHWQEALPGVYIIMTLELCQDGTLWVGTIGQGLKKLAWLMMTQRPRTLQSDDEALLGAGTLQILMGEKVRIFRTIGVEREFQHDQMRAFLAALWLIDETPTIPALQKTATTCHAFELNNRDQEELWGFLATLLKSDANLQELWNFANNDPVERVMIIAALQSKADERSISLLRLARTAN